MNLKLYYDGDCPFCSRYADILGLKNCYELTLCDARVELEWMECREGLSLDDGVIVVLEGRCFQGVEALDMLLGFCRFKGLFFGLQRFVFSRPWLGGVIYGVAKFLRRALLRLQNK